MALRLLRVEIENFRSLEGQWVPADGLVVLFGPNSAGKTSVLEAAENLISQAGALRADPGADDDPAVLGSVMFDLPAADVVGSDDARLYRSLLRGDYIKPGFFGTTDPPWSWSGKELHERLKGADLDQAKSLLSDALARTGDTGEAGDRECLAGSVFEPRAVYFNTDILSTSIGVHRGSLPADAVNAARRIAALPGNDDDPLWKLSHDLVAYGSAHLGWPASGDGHKKMLAAVFPPVITLNGDIESLAAEMERAVPVIHDELWHVDLEVLSREPHFSGVMMVGQNFDIGSGMEGPRYWPDPWLETRSPEGEPVLPIFFNSYDKGNWVRVRHSVLATARIIESEANLIAPDFIKSQGKIGIEILPVSVWGPGQHRVRATFTEFGADQRDLRVVGAGTGRWAAAAIRLACRRLETGRQVVADVSGRLVDDRDERRPIVQKAYSEPLTQTSVWLETSSPPAVYIVDEPEAHLHPAALQSIQKWLSQLAETAAMVLVATHSVALLDCPSELAHRVLVVRNGDTTMLRPMTGALGEELGLVSETLGLTKGELLLMTRLALFVEGPHDQIILDEWFGQDLRAAGVRVFPVHGARNLLGLAESEIIAALGIRMATLTDETSVARVASGAPLTTGEIAVARLIDEAKRAGFKVHAVGLRQPDILYYLDEAICRKVAPKFPGWQIAVNGWVSSGKRGSWKHWVASKYRLPLSRDDIGDLARECRMQHKIPAELSRVVNGLIAYTATPA